MRLSRGFSKFLWKSFSRLSHSSVQGVEPFASCGTRCHLALPSWHTYYITLIYICQWANCKQSMNFFDLAPSTRTFKVCCVVFALLISIPSGRLTEHCCSHLLWLCDTVERGLLPRFVCNQEIGESLLHNFLHPLAPLFRRKGDPLLITSIL